MTSNGNSWKTMALTALFLILIAAFGWGWTSQASRVNMLEEEKTRYAERLAATETALKGIETHLDRIDTSLDKILEGLRHR